MDSNKRSDLGLLILRIAVGAAMIYGHGWGKLLKLTSGDPIKFADPFGLGPEISLVLVVIAEVLCSLLLIVGLFSRYATIPLIVTMLVAIFMVHIQDPFGRMEKAILFLAVYLSIFLMGPGAYSLDTIVRKKT